MNARVAIVGAVQTCYESCKIDQAVNELVYEVVAELLRQTGVPMADIHSQVTASQDWFDGKTISSMSVSEVVGGYLKSESKVAADGIQAMFYGAARIASGSFGYTLVAAHCKESEGQRAAITATMFDPFCQRQLGLHDHLASALQARRYMDKSGITDEDLAEISRRRHRDAMRNEKSLRKGDFTLRQILDSPLVAGPLREMTVGPTCDGACALLLADAEKAKAFGDRAVWISGIGNATDAYWTERELGWSEALEIAAKRAYRMAKVRSPRSEFQVAEITARYAFEEPLYAEALGLADPGKGRHWVERSGIGDGPRINPSGGAITGNPTSVSGLTRIVEAWLQLTGSAGGHQVDDARAVLVHGADGICGQAQSVAVLRCG